MSDARRTSHGVLSYRVSLLIAVPLLILLLGAILGANAYRTTRGSISSLAEVLFVQVAEQTAAVAEAHIHQAVPVAETLAGEIHDEGKVPAAEILTDRLLTLLVANPGFAYVSFSQPDGLFLGAERQAGVIILHRRRVVGDHTIRDEWVRQPDGSLVQRLHSEKDAYDPRVRPFYVQAIAAKTSVWIGPYIFYETGVPGVTCAVPTYAKDGSLLGVASVDFDLNSLSEFVATLHTSPNARVFLYTDDGSLLAHPTVHVAIHHGAKGEGKLLSKDDVPDQATRAYFSGKHAGVVRHVGSEFDVDGVEYFAAASHFDLGGGLAWNVGAIAPQSDFLGDLEKTTQVSLLVSAVALLLALLLATTLAGRVAAPLVNLAEEMEKVGRFELGGAPPPRSMFTEIASMNRALVAMKGGLSSFASYVPRDLVRAVLASGEEATLGGRTKPMTVFFSDLAGFTSIAEAMTPDELVSLLGTYFDEMTRAIAGNGGTIDKFIGDAVMAFWNAPVDEPKHAARACEAALACVATLRAMKTRDAAFERLSARIGIATGDALVGNIGSHDRMNYTVMGDTVNLASRLEGLGKVYGAAVLVSEATHAGASERVVMRAVDVVAVKGRVKGVRIYEPLTPRKGAPAWMLELEQLSAAALDAYVARRWSDAIAGWGRALEVDPADKPARVMRDRAAEYEKDPPGDAWSGVHVMNEK